MKANFRGKMFEAIVCALNNGFSGYCYLEFFESLRKYLNFLFIEYELGNGKERRTNIENSGRRPVF